MQYCTTFSSRCPRDPALFNIRAWNVWGWPQQRQPIDPDQEAFSSWFIPMNSIHLFIYMVLDQNPGTRMVP